MCACVLACLVLLLLFGDFTVCVCVVILGGCDIIGFVLEGGRDRVARRTLWPVGQSTCCI